MRTIVYQAYDKIKSPEMPDWMTACMKTVEDWAAARGFDYEFMEDRLFDYVPPWYAEKVNRHILLVSDLARLTMAKEFIGRGYERTIWVDTDVIVFNPEHFHIPVAEEYAFVRELWMDLDRWRRPRYSVRINGSVTVFTKNNSLLEFYVHACQMIVKNMDSWVYRFEGSMDLLSRLHRIKIRFQRKKTKFSPSAVGTDFLTRLYRIMDFPLLKNVGVFSPVIMQDLASGKHEYVLPFINRHGHPLQAANLTNAFAGQRYGNVTVNDKLFEQVFDGLIETGGDIINRYLNV